MLKYGLKIKVFLFIILLFTLLSFFLFWEFNNFIQKIQIEKSTENTFLLLEKELQNKTFELISSAHEIKKTVDFRTSRSRGVEFDTSNVDVEHPYAILDKTGEVAAGSFSELSSCQGIPSVERALHKGVVSDGYIDLGGSIFITASVPFRKTVSRNREEVFVIFVLKEISSFIESIEYPFPVKFVYKNEILYEKNAEIWDNLTHAFSEKDIPKLIAESTKKDSSQELNQWTFLKSYVFPGTIGNSGNKIAFVSLVRLMPGTEDYNSMLLYMGIFIFVAVVVSLLFTFIVTHEIEKVFINLASDLSSLRVGKKLVLKKYPHGAGVVVSAINHLISKYQKHSETSPGIDMDEIRSRNESMVNLPDKEEQPADLSHSEEEEAFSTEDDEKTMVAPIEELKKMRENMAKQESSDEKPKDPIEVLWEEYKAIKQKNNLTVKENEKNSFTSKIKTNKATIIAKYNCRDVDFSIEEKNGKPVVKAKPVKE
ncbi:MAG: MXAN_5187 C-terminal domain-containing protein [bacterium]